MKVAFIIGHNEKDKGFYSEHLNSTEWDLYNSMRSSLECIGEVYIHDSSINSYTQRCIDISNRIGDKYDLVIALHFNAFNTVANGCEAFYWYSNKDGQKYAQRFVKGYCMLTGTRPRGAKAYNFNSKGELPRGAGEVYYPKNTAILLEPFFGDNKEDCERFCVDKFLQAIRGIF